MLPNYVNNDTSALTNCYTFMFNLLTPCDHSKTVHIISLILFGMRGLPIPGLSTGHEDSLGDTKQWVQAVVQYTHWIVSVASTPKHCNMQNTIPLLLEYIDHMKWEMWPLVFAQCSDASTDIDQSFTASTVSSEVYESQEFQDLKTIFCPKDEKLEPACEKQEFVTIPMIFNKYVENFFLNEELWEDITEIGISIHSFYRNDGPIHTYKWIKLKSYRTKTNLFVRELAKFDNFLAQDAKSVRFYKQLV